MTQSEFFADYSRTAAKVRELEEAMQRLLQYIEFERKSAIEQLARAEMAMNMERTLLPHRERKVIPES